MSFIWTLLKTQKCAPALFCANADLAVVQLYGPSTLRVLAVLEFGLQYVVRP